MAKQVLGSLHSLYLIHLHHRQLSQHLLRGLAKRRINYLSRFLLQQFRGLEMLC